MLVLALLVLLVFMLVVAAATMRAVARDGHGAIAEDRAYDTRRPLP